MAHMWKRWRPLFYRLKRSLGWIVVGQLLNTNFESIYILLLQTVTNSTDVITNNDGATSGVVDENGLEDEEQASKRMRLS